MSGALVILTHPARGAYFTCTVWQQFQVNGTQIGSPSCICSGSSAAWDEPFCAPRPSAVTRLVCARLRHPGAVRARRLTLKRLLVGSLSKLFRRLQVGGDRSQGGAGAPYSYCSLWGS